MTTVTDKDFILAGSSDHASLGLNPEFLDHVGPSLRFLAPVDRRLQCIFCERLCLECWRAACGHSLCATCLDEISNGGSKCPDDGVLITTQTVVRCPDADIEVKNLVTLCPNHETNKCDEHVALFRLRDHMRKCSTNTASRQRALVTDAGTAAKFDSLLSTSQQQNNSVALLGLQVALPANSASSGSGSQLGGVCGDVTTSSAAAIYAALEHRKQVELLRDAMLTLELRMDRMLRLVKDEISEMQDSYSALKSKIVTRVDDISSTVALQGTEMDKLTAKVAQLTRRVEALQTSTSGERERRRSAVTAPPVTDTEPPLDPHLERHLHAAAANCQGVFLWRLTDYGRVRQESGGPHRADVLSAPFLSDSYGYRMCLALDPNGDGSGKGTHISLYVCLMRGPYDDVLSWPFQQRVTFTLMDQRDCRDKNHVTQVLVPDPSWPEFRRPTAEKNLGRGFHKFVPKSVLESSDTYLRNDTLFIKVTVDDDILL